MNINFKRLLLSLGFRTTFLGRSEILRLHVFGKKRAFREFKGLMEEHDHLLTSLFKAYLPSIAGPQSWLPLPAPRSPGGKEARNKFCQGPKMLLPKPCRAGILAAPSSALWSR
jgi:hypothetical protein